MRGVDDLLDEVVEPQNLHLTPVHVNSTVDQECLSGMDMKSNVTPQLTRQVNFHACL